ncbi:MAG TPA: phosphoribosyltransferase family protein [Candidatus Koribacter sp.]
MSREEGLPEKLKVVVSAEQIQHRVGELARQISHDYAGKRVFVVGVLENAFVFMADLIRQVERPTVCQFVLSDVRDIEHGLAPSREIFFYPEVEVAGEHVLLIEGLVQSGLTTDFLVTNLMKRGAASIKTAVLLDRQGARKVSFQPDYWGFQIEADYVVGYGLGAPHLGRNLPYVAATAVPAPVSKQS